MTRPAPLRAHLAAFLTLAPTTLVAFLFTALGALSAFRPAAIPLAAVGGALVGLAERAALDRVGRAHHARHVALSAAAWTVWVTLAGIAGALVFPAFSDLTTPGQLLALVTLASIVGSVPAALVHARSIPGRERRSFAVASAAARIASVVVGTALYRAGSLPRGALFATALFALVLTWAVRPGSADE